jgi:hypothetical protein
MCFEIQSFSKRPTAMLYSKITYACKPPDPSCQSQSILSPKCNIRSRNHVNKVTKWVSDPVLYPYKPTDKPPHSLNAPISFRAPANLL